MAHFSKELILFRSLPLERASDLRQPLRYVIGFGKRMLLKQCGCLRIFSLYQVVRIVHGTYDCKIMNKRLQDKEEQQRRKNQFAAQENSIVQFLHIAFQRL